MIVSIAIVVLPVARSPMISWRWPRPIGVIESIALMPVAIGSWTDWRSITPGACSSRARRSSASISPRPSIGVPSGSTTRPRKPSPTGTERISPVRRTVWPSSMLVEVTEDDDADLAGVEVQRDAEGAVLELEQLVGHRRRQALDPGDAVTGLGDGADLLLAGGRRLVVVDVLLERVPDLLRADRQLRHVPCLFPESVVCQVCLWWWLSRRSLRRASSSRVATVPSMTSSPISTRRPPTSVGSTTTCSWTSCRTACRARRRAAARRRRARWRCARWPPPRRGRLPRGRGTPAATRRRWSPRRATACPTSLVVAGSVLPSSRPASRRAAVRRRSAAGRTARRAAPGSRRPAGRTANSSSPTWLPPCPPSGRARGRRAARARRPGRAGRPASAARRP